MFRIHDKHVLLDELHKVLEKWRAFQPCSIDLLRLSNISHSLRFDWGGMYTNTLDCMLHLCSLPLTVLLQDSEERVTTTPT